jgi:hypothetical protein
MHCNIIHIFLLFFNGVHESLRQFKADPGFAFWQANALPIGTTFLIHSAALGDTFSSIYNKDVVVKTAPRVVNNQVEPLPYPSGNANHLGFLQEGLSY